MSVGSNNNKKPDSEANNDQVPPKTVGKKVNGSVVEKTNGTLPESNGDSTDAAPSTGPRISRTKRRRRLRTSHRTWNDDIMPQGDLTGIFDDEISDQEKENIEEEEEKRKHEGSEDWVTAELPDEDLESMTDDSPSRLEWLRQKKEEDQKNEHLDSLMSMVGLEPVKARFLEVKERVAAAKRWGEDMKDVKLDLVICGQEGTGTLRPQFKYSTALR